MKLVKEGSSVATIEGFEIDEGFAVLADAMPNLVWVARPSGRRVYANRRASDLAGCEPDELLGDGWSRFVHPDDLPGYHATWRRATTRSEDFRFEYRLRTKDGAWRWFEAHACERRGLTDQPLWFGSCVDIHERRDSEERSARIRRRLQATLDNAHVAIAYTRPDGTLTSCNDAMLRLADRDQTQISRGRVHFDDLFPEAPLARVRDVAELLPFECELARPDGSNVPVIVSMEALEEERELAIFVVDLSPQREAARQLQESEARLRQALELAPLPTGIVTEDGDIVLVNKVCRDVLGYAPEDIPNVDVWSQIAYPHARPDIPERVDALFSTSGPSDEGEREVRTRSGESCWWHFHVSPLGRSPEGLRQLVVMAVDVTEQRRAEQEASDFSTRLHAYFEAANVGFCEIEPGTMRYVDFNDAFCRMVGRTREELLSLDVYSVVHPDDRVVGAPESDPRSAPSSEPLEKRVLRPDGQVVWVLAHVTAVRGPDGDIRSLFSTVVDISGLHAAVEALRVSERRFRLAASASRVMVYELTLDREGVQGLGERTQASSAVFETHGSQELLGIDPESLRDVQRWRDRIHPDDALDWLSDRQRLVRQGGDLTAEYRVRHRDGHWVHVLDRCRIERQGADDGGDDRADPRFVGTLIEITDLKRYEEALQRADRHKNEFITMLGHELRNPLAAVRYASQLQRSVQVRDDRLRRSTEVIDRQTALMGRLLDDLLDVSRIERGKIHLERGLVDLVEVVRHVVDDQEPVVRARGLELDEQLPTTRIWIDADRTRIAQAVGNLVSNALKFTDAPGRITVRVGRGDDQAWFEVADTGIGIDPAFLPQLFEPFQQAGPSGRGDGGLGLGLSLVRGIVELHGGTVHVESPGIGKGSRFVVRLPCAAVSTDAEPEVAEVAPPRRVLLVEDNRDSAEVLRDLLEIAGYVVRVAHDGPTALRIQQQFDAEVVLCDLGLPGGMSGFDVARRLRAEHLDPPLLVALTGYGGDDVRTRAVEAGFHLHVTKPVDVDEIVQVIEDLSNDH